MFIVVGLGNPGQKYAKTRHNVGYMVVDAVLRREPALAKLIHKTTTHMNESGAFVKKFRPKHFAVIHDDVDLPLGTIRIRRGGQSAGHRGVQSIIDAVGEDFWRVRVGVARPAVGVETYEYVLEPFKKNEQKLLNKVIDAAVTLVIDSLRSGKFEETTIVIKS